MVDRTKHQYRAQSFGGPHRKSSSITQRLIASVKAVRRESSSKHASPYGSSPKITEESAKLMKKPTIGFKLNKKRL